MDNPEYANYTILIAEDNESNFEYLRQVFRPTGLTIIHAINGQEAIDCCQNHPEIGLSRQTHWQRGVACCS